MTTQVQERLPAATMPVRRRSARGSWLVFLVATVLAALAIGVVAALLGSAVKGLGEARGLLDSAQQAFRTAQVETQAAEAAEAEAKAAIEARQQQIVEELQSQEHGSSFSANASGPQFAEVRAMEASLRQHETAALAEARQAEESARATVGTAEGDAADAQNAVDAVMGPFWTVTIVSGIVLLLLAAVAILRTRAVRRR